MSNCANIINRLSREVCNIKEELVKSECGRNVLELNTAITRGLDTIAYLVPDNKDHINDCGIPLQLKRTDKCCDKVYDALLVNETTDKDAVLVNTKDLRCFTQRHCTGFLCFCKTLSVCVENVDLSVLSSLDQSLLLAALQYCSTTQCTGTLTLEAYNALLSVLTTVGIRSIAVNQAACVYKYLMRNLKSDSNNVCEDECDNAEPAEPAEPTEPFEPSEIVPDIYVKHIADTYTTSDNTTSNDQIEEKLRKLLESTETTDTQ